MELDGLNKDAYINKGKLEYEMKSYRDALSTYNHGIVRLLPEPLRCSFRRNTIWIQNFTILEG